jgi:hypothetical protein
LPAAFTADCPLTGGVNAASLKSLKTFRVTISSKGHLETLVRGFLVKFSTSDLTILRIRCPKCGQHTEKIVTVLVRKDAIQCGTCGARISLSTPTNEILIAETSASCSRVGEALIKGMGLE